MLWTMRRGDGKLIPLLYHGLPFFASRGPHFYQKKTRPDRVTDGRILILVHSAMSRGGQGTHCDYFAPLEIMKLRSSLCCRAKKSGVRPFSFSSLMLSPFARRYLTTSMLPPEAA